MRKTKSIAYQKDVLLLGASLLLLLGLIVMKDWAPVKKQITFVTDKYIFSGVDDQNFEGEGFFVTLQNGEELFVTSAFRDNPHDIENVRRKLFGAIKTKGLLTCPLPSYEVDVFLATKYDLRAENRVLTEKEYQNLATKVRERSVHKKIRPIRYQEIEVPQSGMRFSCQEMAEVDGLTMTTGGSVFLITVHFNSVEPLNIGLATNTPDGKEKLLNLSKKIEGLKGTNASITAKNVSYQHEIYTTHGIRTGWVANIADITIQ